ncbi:PrgI family protein [Nocardia carnea]|uniref:PrgI family protein n=1 Tax=Nocardia carnea TaxID=37328 RepID=UPI0024582A48|nr:PrgI family protein [Nocardia carnea]
MSTPVRIPADVDRPDRLIGPFTARQLAVLAVTALLLYLAWTATREVIPPAVFVAAAVPVGAVVATLVLATRDGLSGDRMLLAALRHRLRPRRLVSAPEGIVSPPRWVTRAAGRGSKPQVPQPLSAKALQLPESITSNSGIGVVDLGPDGLAVIAAAGTVNLALRTPEEQDSLVAQLGGWLHTLRQPVQILLRSTRLDLSGQLGRLRESVGEMSPELAAAAHGHADHLEGLAASEDLLHRQVLLVWREPLDLPTTGDSLGGPSPVAMLGWLASGRRRARRELSGAARRAAESRLLRRVHEATDLLAPMGVTLTPLDDLQATAVATGACNPGRLVPSSADIAGPYTVITTTGGEQTRDEVAPVADTAPTTTPQRGLFGPRGRRNPGGVSEFGPDSLAIGARHLEVGSGWVATLAVTGYPREVTAGWLAPLLSHPGRLDVAVHVDPVDPVTAASRLRRQLARLESSRMHDAGYGRRTDPLVEVAAEDAADLSARVARAEARLFRVGVYLTVHAGSEAELADEVAAVRALAASLLVDTCPLSFRTTQGWVSTLPFGLDLVGLRRTFDTNALAAAFPFSSPQLPVGDPAHAASPEGVLYGRDAAAGLVFVDRFGAEADNHNAVVLGRSGAGKSYFVKTEVLRSLYRGIEQVIIDPEDEYRTLTEAVGGTYIHLGAPGIRLNPFDLEVHTRTDGRRTAPSDALTRRKLFCHTVIQVLLGEQTPAQRATLDNAVTATYTRAGITDDPATWTRPAPTLGMLCEQLAALGSAVADDLAAGLSPFVGDGAFAGLLDGPTTVSPDGAMVAYSLRELPDELKTIGTLLVLDATWRRVADPAGRRPRMVTVDEAWLIMRQPAGAQFLFRAAKSFRKYWAGLTVATQDCADVLGTDLGKAIVSNAATQILLHQAPQAIDEVAGAFKLSDGERQFLLSAARGQGLLAIASTDRAVFASLASPEEHALITTDPSELADTVNSGKDGVDLTDTLIAGDTEDTGAGNEDGYDEDDGDDAYVDVQAA